jgi:hypothetical protein
MRAIASSNGQSTPENIQEQCYSVTELASKTIGNAPDQHMTVSQCCFEVDGAERWYGGSSNPGGTKEVTIGWTQLGGKKDSCRISVGKLAK